MGSGSPGSSRRASADDIVPPPLRVPLRDLENSSSNNENNVRMLWQRMLEHSVQAQGAPAPASEASSGGASDDEDGGVVVLLARTPTSLVVGVDVEDETWRRHATSGRPPVYDLEIRQSCDSEWTECVTGSSERSHAVEGLSPDSQYQIRLRRDSRGWSRASLTMRTGPGIPDAPAPPVVVDVGASSVALRWDCPESHGLKVDEYCLECRAFEQPGEEANAPFEEAYSGDEDLACVEGLEAGRIYLFRVAARNHVGRGDWSARTAVRTLRSSGAQPQDLELSRKRSKLNRALANHCAERLRSVAPEVVSQVSPYARLRVKREALVATSKAQFPALLARGSLHRGSLRVQFEGEIGVDAGGLAKEWFVSIANELCDERLGLFRRCEVDDLCAVDERGVVAHGETEALELYHFFGLVLGKCVLDRRAIAVRLERTLLRALLGKNCELEDLVEIDPHRLTGLRWALMNNVDGVLFESFCLPDVSEELLPEEIKSPSWGVQKIIELMPKGRKISVTESNKHDWVNRVVEFIAVHRAETSICAIVAGFREFVPEAAVSGLEVEDLRLIISGRPDVDLKHLLALTRFAGGFTSESPQVQWFFAALAGFDSRERCAVLQWVTGLGSCPLDGFDPPFTVARLDADDHLRTLPRAHTCFNQILFPEYPSAEILVEKLRFAVANSQGFHIT